MKNRSFRHNYTLFKTFHHRLSKFLTSKRSFYSKINSNTFKMQIKQDTLNLCQLQKKLINLFKSLSRRIRLNN